MWEISLVIIFLYHNHFFHYVGLVILFKLLYTLMTFETFVFNSALIVFCFYMIACIVRTTIKTFCFISLIKGLEDIAEELLKNKLPEILAKKCESRESNCCGSLCCSLCGCGEQKELEARKQNIENIESLYQKEALDKPKE